MLILNQGYQQKNEALSSKAQQQRLLTNISDWEIKVDGPEKLSSKKTLQHLDLWETRNHDPPPCKVLLKYYIPKNKQHLEQLTFAGDLQYPEPDNHNNNRYEDDYSQLPDEELCLKHASSR